MRQFIFTALMLLFAAVNAQTFTMKVDDKEIGTITYTDSSTVVQIEVPQDASWLFSQALPPSSFYGDSATITLSDQAGVFYTIERKEKAYHAENKSSTNTNSTRGWINHAIKDRRKNSGQKGKADSE